MFTGGNYSSLKLLLPSSSLAAGITAAWCPSLFVLTTPTDKYLEDKAELKDEPDMPGPGVSVSFGRWPPTGSSILCSDKLSTHCRSSSSRSVGWK